MLKHIAAVVIGCGLAAQAAAADTPYRHGSMQEQYTCPTGDCHTLCVGPGGPQTIAGYKVLTAWLLDQPDRLWLDIDGHATVVLGVGDRCTFEGAPMSIVQSTGSSPLGPYQPARICIGAQCN